ncbi:nucleoside hydrolase [Actinotignum urinale]|uniref:Nucleoside hydrolase n=2 Tax=Actinotignum TaxID=1653174 RepID=A0AAW9HVM8_9ACTO|nr:nucleoside hydrolase [Actinotignum urinale]MDY5129319.1 nucleoside hydrolase [Actinotignum urinale]MDY5133266.1 nucleoside hydrolase [Actinotignum urinale]MDY5151716.1 nucleoside hydrolase [Actinotignum urinale]MDY5154395.1 nucleoside hydrolase [Actinotignum urinale]MDY5160410.1 nucleoside hydrolase [Actinotignum urinale]
MSAPRKIILDCDPGHDDAVAMILAYGNPDIDLVAVTTVSGNQSLTKVTRNALSVGTICGIKGIPFAAGADRPIVRPLEYAPDIHGDSGMDGPEQPEKSTIELDPRHAAQLIIDVVMAHEPGEITLVPTGALTNIALAARMEPKIVERVREVVLMGGGYHVGNWSPVAEFNIKIDPEAAHIVFNEKWPVVMVGLDLTHQALCTPDAVEKIEKVGTGPAKFVRELMDFFAETYKDAQGFDYPPVHDPCAVAYIIDPTIVKTQKVPVDIELTGTLTLGMTVADFRAPAPEDCHTWVATELDHGRFWDLIVDALERIGEGGMTAEMK